MDLSWGEDALSKEEITAEGIIVWLAFASQSAA